MAPREAYGSAVRRSDDLMRLHVEAAFSHDSDGRMLAVNDGAGGRAPLFFLGRTADVNVWRFRHDAPQDLVAELEELCRAEPPAVPTGPTSDDMYAQVIERHGGFERVWKGPTYYFPEELAHEPDAFLITDADDSRLLPHFEEWLEDPPECQPFVALLVDGVAVSVCASVRITAEAHEAGVETPERLRGRGYAGRATIAWAAAVRAMEAVPLYSTSWENTASQAVANKLGLVRFGATLHFT